MYRYVKGIDALGRDNAAKLLMQLGLADARVPLLLPGWGCTAVLNSVDP